MKGAAMSRRWPVLLLAVFVLGNAIAVGMVAGADPAAPDQVKTTARPSTHVPCDTPSRDNVGSLVANHFGNPALGRVALDTWIRQTYDPETCLPSGVTGQGRGFRAYRVARISLQVILHTRGGTGDDNATHDPVNSGSIGNPYVFTVSSPSISAGLFDGQPQFCFAWTELRWGVRWDDGYLSTGTLTAPSDLWNDNCYFVAAGAAPTRQP
jgi:hypothetical protein